MKIVKLKFVNDWRAQTNGVLPVFVRHTAEFFWIRSNLKNEKDIYEVLCIWKSYDMIKGRLGNNKFEWIFTNIAVSIK